MVKPDLDGFILPIVTKLGPIPDISEIAEVKMMDSLPENLTHPDIQPHLYNRVLDYLKTKEYS